MGSFLCQKLLLEVRISYILPDTFTDNAIILHFPLQCITFLFLEINYKIKMLGVGFKYLTFFHFLNISVLVKLRVFNQNKIYSKREILSRRIIFMQKLLVLRLIFLDEPFITEESSCLELIIFMLPHCLLFLFKNLFYILIIPF